jgi:hypothetical protein
MGGTRGREEGQEKRERILHPGQEKQNLEKRAFSHLCPVADLKGKSGLVPDRLQKSPAGATAQGRRG